MYVLVGVCVCVCLCVLSIDGFYFSCAAWFYSFKSFVKSYSSFIYLCSCNPFRKMKRMIKEQKKRAGEQINNLLVLRKIKSA